MALYIPEGYKSCLTTRQTQIAIKKVKDFFERDLSMSVVRTQLKEILARMGF